MVEIIEDNNQIAFTYKATGDKVHILGQNKWKDMQAFMDAYQDPGRTEILPKLEHFTKFMKNGKEHKDTLSDSDRLKEITRLIEAESYNPSRKTILLIHQLATKS